MREEKTAVDRAALEDYLARGGDGAAARAVRLAYQAGLTRAEVCALTWAQVGLADGALHLPDRNVPLSSELAEALARWRELDREGVYVVPAADGGARAPQSLSRTVHAALKKAGVSGAGFPALRRAYVEAQLREHDWPYVLRVTGMAAATYRSEFAGTNPVASPAPEGAPDAETEEFLLWKLLQENRTTPEGVALWLLWQMDLSEAEVCALTWEQVDLARGVLRLPGRDVPLTNAVRGVLADAYAGRGVLADAYAGRGAEDEYVVCSPRTRRGVSEPRLSLRLRELLVRGGLTASSLRTLRAGARERKAVHDVRALLIERGGLTASAVRAALGLSRAGAYRALEALTESGEVLHISSVYYPTGTVVPPERQEAAVLAVAREMERIYLADVTARLGLPRRAAQGLLSRMVREGALALDPRRKQYFLPGKSDVSKIDK